MSRKPFHQLSVENRGRRDEINPLRQRIHFLKEESSSFPFGPQDEVLYLVGDLDSNRHLCHILCSGSVFR